MYEDSVSSRISNENFTRLVGKYQEEQEQLQTQIGSLESALREVKEIEENAVKWADLMAYYVGIQELTAENLNALIERIEVFDRAEVDGAVKQTVKVYYRFGGSIAARRFNAKVLKH